MLRFSSLYFITGLVIALANCSSGSLRDDSKFSYKNVYRDKYEEGKGGVIPVTFEKGEAFSGTITADGNYLFFSSNRLGNYDIYLRALDDVENVPVIKTATNQREPSISPDGKKLVYIDDELDPDGDLLFVSINPKTVVKRFREGDPEPFKPGVIIGRKKNLTNSEKRRVRSRESNPVWSPDSQRIAFSSDMVSVAGSDFGPGFAAVQNIWLLDPDSPDKADKLTDKGGVMPAFSPDGSRIVYVSYEKANSNGDIYEFDLGTRQRRKLTGGKAIDLNPAYSPDGTFLFFTRISKDSNGDGHIDRKDSGQIFKMRPAQWRPTSDVKTSADNTASEIKSAEDDDDEESEDSEIWVKKEREAELTPVTLSTDNVFDTRISSFLGGAITFAFTAGEDVNIAFIPVDGLVPRKFSIKEQLKFAEEFNEKPSKNTKAKKSNETYIQALNRVKDFFPQDALLPIYGAEADLKLVQIISGSEKSLLVEKIRSKISAGENLYRLLLDASKFTNELQEARTQLTYPALVEAANLKDYYEKVLQKRDILKAYRPVRLRQLREKKLAELETKSEKNPSNKPGATDKAVSLSPEVENSLKAEYERQKNIYLSLLSELRLRYAQILKAGGNSKEYVNNLVSLLRENPAFTDAAKVVFQIGEARLDADVPDEFLHILYPSRFPLKITKAAENTQEDDESAAPETKKVLGTISVSVTVKEKERTERALYAYFVRQYERANSSFIKLIAEKYKAESFPEIYSLHQLAAAQYAITNLAADNAETALQNARKYIVKNTIWDFHALRINGEILEFRNSPEGAFSEYYNALIIYRREMRYDKADALMQRVLTYYSENAKRELEKSDYNAAWLHYRKVAELQIDMYAKNFKRADLKSQILDTMIDINLMTIARIESDEKFYEKVLSFYNEKMDIARRDLNNSFIFSRAYLDTQLGINLHRKYEEDGMSSSRKERVLKLFKTAEIDFKWSFFADPYFADSYVMLGWMYQFIDEKREQLIDDADQKKDKDEYESLYTKYFAEYLFEENIRIYQKSISYFADRLSPKILRSFHLNMGNNYFLLGNYAKARENYEMLVDKKGDLQYNFESEKQKALFAWHLGRTLYYTGDYLQALKFLKMTLQIYEKDSPINTTDSAVNAQNFQKRNKLLRMLALTSDISGDRKSAVDYYTRIISEQDQVGITEDRSFLYIEKARYAYEAEDYDTAFEMLTEAEAYLAAEKEVKAPKFKIRIKWLGFYEPWTFLTSLVYTHDYDKVYNGQNKLVFSLPTVNRWQYIWSLKAEIYKKKNLLNESAAALLQLVEHAKADKTVHGNETLNAAYMRLGEVQYSLKHFPEARKFYDEAFNLAEKRSDFLTQSKVRKNLLAIATFDIENTPAEIDQKLKTVTAEIANLQKFRESFVEKSVESAIKLRKKQNENVQLTEGEINAIRKKAGKQIYSQLLYNGVFNSHIADLKDTAFRENAQPYSYTAYMNARADIFREYQKTLQYFSGNIEDSQSSTGWVNYLDKKDYALRIKLAMNRGRLYQNMFMFPEARTEYASVLESANEFQAQLISILVSYRMYRISENQKEAMAHLNRASNMLKDNPEYVVRYADLYNSVAQRQTEEFLKQGQYIEAINIEDQRRHYSGWDIYSDRYNLNHEKGKKLINEYNYFIRQKSIFRDRIELARFNRSDSKADEKTLAEIDKNIAAIKKALASIPEISDFMKLTFPSQDIRDYVRQSGKSILYILRQSDQVAHFLTLRPPGIKKGKSRKKQDIQIEYERFLVSNEQIAIAANQVRQAKGVGEVAGQTDWLGFMQKANADIVFTDKDFLKFPFSKLYRRHTILESTLTAAALFSGNKQLPAFNVMQINQPKKGFGLFAGGATTYNAPLKVSTVSSPEDWKKVSSLRGIIDYEASLAGNTRTEDINTFDITVLSESEATPTGAFISYNAGSGSNSLSEYKFFTATNLILSANGVSAVLHSGAPRKNSVTLFEKGFYNQTKNTENAIASGNISLFKSIEESSESPESKDVLLKSVRVSIDETLKFAAEKYNSENYAEALYSLGRGEDLVQMAETVIKTRHEKASLLLVENKVINLIAIGNLKGSEEIYSAYKAANKSPQVTELFRKRVFALFKHGFAEDAIRVIAAEGNLYENLPESGVAEFTEAYIFGQIAKGNLSLFAIDFPKELAKSEKMQNWGLSSANTDEAKTIRAGDKQILERWAGKTKTISKDDWSAALVKAGYYEFAEKLGIFSSEKIKKNSKRWYAVWQSLILPEAVTTDYPLAEIVKGKTKNPDEALRQLKTFEREYYLLRKHLSAGDVSAALLHAGLSFRSNRLDHLRSDALIWPLVLKMSDLRTRADEVKAIAQFLSNTFRELEKKEPDLQLKYKYGLISGLPDFLRSAADFNKYREKNARKLSTGNVSLELLIALTSQRFTGLDLQNFKERGSSYTVDAQANDIFNKMRTTGTNSKTVSDPVLLSRMFMFFLAQKDFQNALQTLFKLEKEDTNLKDISTGRFTLMGISEVFPGEMYAYKYRNGKAEIEKLKDISAVTIEKFIRSESDRLLYLGKLANFTEIESLRIPAGTIYVNKLSNLTPARVEPAALPMKTPAMVFKKSGENSPLTSLMEIALPKAKPDQTNQRAITVGKSAENKSFLHIFDGKYSEVEIRKLHHSGYLLVCEDRAAYNIFLQFADELAREIRKENSDIVADYKKVQQSLGKSYPREVVSFWLIHGKNL